MVQSTTPTFVLTLPQDIDLSEAENVYFTLQQAGTFITKTGDQLTVSGNTVVVALSQTDTVALLQGTANVQLNWTYSGGLRAASEIVKIKITKNLITVVIE